MHGGRPEAENYVGCRSVEKVKKKKKKKEKKRKEEREAPSPEIRDPGPQQLGLQEEWGVAWHDYMCVEYVCMYSIYIYMQPRDGYLHNMAGGDGMRCGDVTPYK